MTPQKATQKDIEIIKGALGRALDKATARYPFNVCTCGMKEFNWPRGKCGYCSLLESRATLKASNQET